MKEAKYFIKPHLQDQKGSAGGDWHILDLKYHLKSFTSFKMRDLKDGEKLFVDAGTQAQTTFTVVIYMQQLPYLRSLYWD